MDVFFSEPSTLWAGGIYDIDELLNRVNCEDIYVCVSV